MSVTNQQRGFGHNKKVVAAKPATTASEGGGKPSHILRVRKGDEFITLSGLWEAEDKNGNSFLKGTDKESGSTYFVMLNSFRGEE